MINMDYYGQSETWIPYNASEEYKYPTYISNPSGTAYIARTRGTLSDLYRIGTLPFNEYPDLSVCYAGMLSDADLCHVVYIGLDGAVATEQPPAAVPFFMAAAATLNPTAAGAAVDPTQNSNTWGMDTDTVAYAYDALSNGDSGITPIVSMHGRSVVLLVGVTAANSGNSVINPSLDEWRESYSSEYTRIIRIWCKPMVYGMDGYRQVYEAPVWSTYIDKGSMIPVICDPVATAERVIMTMGRSGTTFPSAGGGFVVSGSGGSGAPGVIYPQGSDDIIVPVFGSRYHYVHIKDSGGFKYMYGYMDPADYGSADELVEYARRQAAYLGLFFTGDSTLAQSLSDDAFTDPDMYLGVITSEGYTNGNYTHGADNADQPQYTTTDMQADSRYDPEKPVDPNNYDTRSRLNRGTGLTGFGMGAACYAVSTAEISGLMTYLYTVVPELLDPETQTDYSKYFLNQNPVDLVVSLTAFPFDLTPYIASRRTLTIGNQAVKAGLPAADVTVGVIGGSWGSDAASGIVTLDAGHCTYYPTFGDYRDYEGSAELYIPYCGSVHIDPATYMGHQISVRYLVDLRTGACLALIYRDQLITDSIPGQMGVSIPFSGLQQADYQKALHNAKQQLLQKQSSEITGLVGGLVSMGAGAATGNPLAIAGGAAAIARSAATAAISDAEWQLQHVKAPIRSIGTASAATSMVNEQSVRLVITRPKMLSYDPAAYAHSVGYACYRVGSLSEYSGYTQAVSVDLSGIAATDDELQMIRAALASGIYL